MSWKGALRAADAAHRRREREEVKRLRDLERRTKEQAKLSALEQARLEVETHETRIDLLLSIHKEPIEVWNWLELIAALHPCSPSGSSSNQLNEKLIACAEARAIEASALEDRRADDRRALEQGLADHAASQEVRKGHRETAACVVRADLEAWTTAIAQMRLLRKAMVDNLRLDHGAEVGGPDGSRLEPNRHLAPPTRHIPASFVTVSALPRVTLHTSLVWNRSPDELVRL